jgi:hypothetical protein
LRLVDKLDAFLVGEVVDAPGLLLAGLQDECILVVAGLLQILLHVVVLELLERVVPDPPSRRVGHLSSRALSRGGLLQRSVV